MDLRLCYAILFSSMESPRKTTMVVKNRLTILPTSDINWVNTSKNVNESSSENDTTLNNSNSDSTPNDKMTAKGVLICRDNSHPFQDRTLLLDHPVKIGRSVARAKASPCNAIFDCKVLSRNHAILWYDSGKFYLQDTKSSNGTFVNNNRLSSSGQESNAREVCSGDIVQFGVNVVEDTKKLTHGCIVATLKLYLPDGKEAKASSSSSVDPVAGITFEDLYMLNQFVQEANRREQALQYKLSYLQQLVENTQLAANQSWKALIDEDRLLSRVETVESQLVFFSKNFSEDKVRNELVKLHEEKAQYQNAAKEALQKILQEKLDVTHRLIHLETRLNNTEEECQSLYEVKKHTEGELQELAAKYTEAQKKLQETTNKLMESDDKLQEMTVRMEEEKKQLSKQLKDQTRIEKVLQAKLENSKISCINVHKEVSALTNYVRTLQDAKSKQLSDENSESKDDLKKVQLSISVILNKLLLYTQPGGIFDNRVNNDIWQDNLVNSDNSEEIKNLDTDDLSYKDLINDSISDSMLNEYILPPSNRRLFNGGYLSIENMNVALDSDTNSEITEDTCSVTSEKDAEINDSLLNSEKSNEYILPPSRRTLVNETFVNQDDSNTDIDSDTNSEVTEVCSVVSVKILEDNDFTSNSDKLNDYDSDLSRKNVFIDNSMCQESLKLDTETNNDSNIEEITKDVEMNDSTSTREQNESNWSPSRRTLIRESNQTRESLTSDPGSDNNTNCQVAEAETETAKKTCDDGTKEKHALNKNGSTTPKLEVRFADGDGKQLERRYESEEEKEKTEEDDSGNNSSDSQDSPLNPIRSITVTVKEDEKSDKEEKYEKSEVDFDGEHLEGEYVKTLKPLSKSDSSKTVQVQEFILQNLIGCMDSLKEDDSQEAQNIVNRELEDLKDWLMREHNETVLNKLKDIYYRSKNETQRMREVNEELVILKEKCNAFVDEKAELVKNYVTLKSQCGDLLNTTYTVPIHYVAPIALALIWMLLEKLF